MPKQCSLKIALLQSPTFPLNIDYHGGIERVELGQLEILNKMGHVAHLYVPKIIGKKSNVKALRDFGWRNRILKWLYFIQFYLRSRKYDICHGHYTPELITLLYKKSVLNFHGLAVKELPLYRQNYFKRRYHKAHYAFCAYWVKLEFQKIYPEIPEKNLHVLHYGCAIDHFQPRIENNGKNEFSLKICWYGLWEDSKGVFDLLEAFEKAKKNRKDISLSIGGSAFYEGDTKEAKNIEEKVRKWAERLNVSVAGRIKYEDLPEFINSHHIGIFPSKYRDPFPSVPLEMMACGLPVIAYDYGGPRECIVQDVTGFLVENGNIDKIVEKIEWFADNREKMHEMSLAARRHIEQNFTWEEHARKLLVVYEKIINVTAQHPIDHYNCIRS